ncbi:PAS domain-containing protein [Muricoccus vinaceus]|uniref:histidine kinase n=1 Tax=Muricoccus vinaceus TaxID=424704 RepID=A0ABV6IXG8_9PROT
MNADPPGPAGAPDLSGSVGALSAAILGAALDVAGLATVITDAPLDPPGPRIRYANAHFEAITGYTAAELIGRSPRLLQGPETDRAELDRLRDGLTTTGQFTGATVNYRKDGSPYRNEWIVGPILGRNGEVTHWLSIQRDATQAPDPHPQAAMLRDRTRAMLKTVRAIATRTLVSPDDGRVFGDRLAALGRAQAAAGRTGTDLETLLRGELAARSVGARLEGPPVALRPGIAEPLALALHELAAVARGAVSVTWAVEDSIDRRLHIAWTERGGSPAPSSGWTVIEEALRFALGGEVQRRREGSALFCTIALPLAG